MARWISVGLLTLVLGTAVGANAVPRPNPFPLADGNRWVLRDIETNAARTLAVREQGPSLVLHGLPGALPMRVRWAGETVQVWDTSNERWEALFRFGEPVGESYLVRLGDTLLWRNVAVTVASKRARVDDHRGRTLVSTRFTFASKSKIADAGVESMSFAPRVGPVHIAEQSIAGTRELTLVAARLR